MDRGGKTLLERAPILPRGVMFALGIGAAFGLGIVFAGGIGKARGQVMSAPASADVLVRASEKGRALDDKRAAMKLSYAAELLKPDAVHVDALASKSAAASAPEPAAAPIEPPPAPLADAKPDQKAEAKAAHDDADMMPVIVERTDPKRLQAAIARVLGDAPVVLDPKPVAHAFALQVASTPTRAGAEDVAHPCNGRGWIDVAEVGHHAGVTLRRIEHRPIIAQGTSIRCVAPE